MISIDIEIKRINRIKKESNDKKKINKKNIDKKKKKDKIDHNIEENKEDHNIEEKKEIPKNKILLNYSSNLFEQKSSEEIDDEEDKNTNDFLEITIEYLAKKFNFIK